MNNDFIHTYNPNNASNLTEQDIAAMQTLTDEQIRQLAERYPNHGVMNSYLILKDTSAKSQIYPVSTWQSLYNLRVKNGMKRYVAFTFKSLFIKRNVTNIPIQPKVQDLTQQEIEGAEGIRRKAFIESMDEAAGKGIEEMIKEEKAHGTKDSKTAWINPADPDEFDEIEKRIPEYSKLAVLPPSDENGEFPELTVPDKPKRTRKKITNNKNK